MTKFLICVVLITLVGAVVVAQDELVPDYWDDYGPSYSDYDTIFKNTNNDENIETSDLDNDRKVKDEIEQFRVENEDNVDPVEEQLKKIFEGINDYQYEDNRSKSKEEVQNNEESDEKQEEVPFENDEVIKSNSKENDEIFVSNNQKSENIDDFEVNDKMIDTKDSASLWNEPIEQLNQYPEEDKNIFDETQAILNEEENNDFEEIVNPEEQPEPSDFSKIFEETKEILNEDDEENDFEAKSQIDKSLDSANEAQDTNQLQNVDNVETVDKLDDLFQENELVEDDAINSSKFEDEEEDTVDKVYADLHEDLNNLVDTWAKLTDGDYDEQDDVNLDDVMNMDVKDYEEKYDKPYREGLVLSQRDDYENVEDSNLSDIFAENSKMDASADEFDGANENVDDDVEPIESMLDKQKKDLNVQTEPKPDNDIDTQEPRMYKNDAFDDNNKDEISTEYTDKSTITTEAGTKFETETVMVDDLSSAELKDIITQFEIAHREELDVHSEIFDKNIAPVRIILNSYEPVVVTSPNYPEVYPTDNIIDWIFEGEGVGIEFNITDLAINGALGDYLLVKPGGIDSYGHEGLIFTYRLTSEMRYRYTDVNRMFVRFEAKPGMPFMRGFKFSVKLLAPLPKSEEDVEPETLLTPPVHTLTLNFGGITAAKFHEVEHEFRLIIADMAQEYITAQGIDLGLNTTSEITQVTRTSVCNIQWPQYEDCVEVTFGVPLTYEEEDELRLNEEDLIAMWTTYVNRDPFALRLRRLGITEFAVPDDRSVLMMWLVIASGVVISMALLAFALWRFSCFEDYTRMKSFSDTDSYKAEKRGLDLYPTPHQTLPPLYSESEYKWDDGKFDDSTRVDMGGFANKSYVRDELFDIESDEDVITTRDRYTTNV